MAARRQEKPCTPQESNGERGKPLPQWSCRSDRGARPQQRSHRHRKTKSHHPAGGFQAGPSVWLQQSERLPLGRGKLSCSREEGQDSQRTEAPHCDWAAVEGPPASRNAPDISPGSAEPWEGRGGLLRVFWASLSPSLYVLPPGLPKHFVSDTPGSFLVCKPRPVDSIALSIKWD